MGSIFHKIKRAGEHTARMAKYAVEEGGMSHSERVARREEIMADPNMSEKEKRERIRAMKETTVGKKAIKAGKLIGKIVK